MLNATPYKLYGSQSKLNGLKDDKEKKITSNKTPKQDR